MKNLQNYNQKLLAVIGTLVVVGLIMLIGAGVYAFLSEQFRQTRSNARDNGIVIDQNQVVDTTSFSFKQEISILEPYQLDSAKPVFIVPIGQKDQKSKRLSLSKAGFDFDYEYADSYQYSNFMGLYNNFVLIDYTKDLRIPIFKSKVAITEWAYMKIDSSRLILFKGTDTDINNDGLLNDDDFQNLFVFNVETLQTKELRFKDQTVRSFQPLTKTSKIYVRTGKDINNDHAFNAYKEPSDLYFFDVATGESETLVPDDIKKSIQEILNKQKHRKGN